MRNKVAIHILPRRPTFMALTRNRRLYILPNVVPQTQSRLLLGIGHRRKLNRWSSTGGVLEATVSDVKQKNGQFSAIISSVGREIEGHFHLSRNRSLGPQFVRQGWGKFIDYLCDTSLRLWSCPGTLYPKTDIC